MNDMDLEQIITIVHDWAKSEPNIRTAYIFGSRVRGNYTTKSDVDIAVEIYQDKHDVDITLTWGDIHPVLSDRLSSLLPYTVQLELYEESITNTIRKALREGSILAYDDKHDIPVSQNSAAQKGGQP